MKNSLVLDELYPFTQTHYRLSRKFDLIRAHSTQCVQCPFVHSNTEFTTAKLIFRITRSLLVLRMVFSVSVSLSLSHLLLLPLLHTHIYTYEHTMCSSRVFVCLPRLIMVSNSLLFLLSTSTFFMFLFLLPLLLLLMLLLLLLLLLFRVKEHNTKSGAHTNTATV